MVGHRPPPQRYQQSCRLPKLFLREEMHRDRWLIAISNAVLLRSKSCILNTKGWMHRSCSSSRAKYRLFSGFRRMLCLFGRCRPWGTDNGHDSWRIFTFVRAFAVLLMGTRIALFERKRWVRGYITADVRPSPRWTFSVFAEIDRKSPLIFSRCRQALATHNADALNGGMPRSVEPMLKEVWRRLVTQAVE